MASNSQSTVFDLANSRPLAVAVVDTTGTQLPGFDSSRPTTAILTSVPSSITSVTILALNAARRQFIVHNQSTANLYLAFSATSSVTAFTVLVPSNGEYESVLGGYTGLVTGIWNLANGNARVTEVTT